MDNKSTRAKKMAESYAIKLKNLIETPQEPRIIKISDEQTPDQKLKLKKALEKLRTFLD